MGARPVGHVIVDAHREGVGLLEHHTHLAAQLAHVHSEHVLLLVEHRAGNLDAGDQIVHTVQRFKKRGLAAAGGADEGGDALFRYLHADVVQRLRGAVPQVQVLHGDDVAHVSCLLLKYRPTSVAVRLMSSASTIRMDAMAKATSNSPCSLA